MLGMIALGIAGATIASSGKKKGKVYVPTLSPQGSKIKTALSTSIISDLYPADLSYEFKGAAKKLLQAQTRQANKALSRWQVTGPENVLSGKAARGLLDIMKNRLGTSQSGAAMAGEAEREYKIKNLANIGNLLNIDSTLQLGHLRGSLLKKEMSQAQGAQRGAALGSLAQLAMMATMMQGA